MIRCGCYLRQSEDPKDDELAISRQWDELVEKICKPRGWEPVRYCDNDRTAVGKKRKLPDRDRMLRDIEAGKLQAMAAWDCDRLYREPVDLERIIDIADEHHTLLATVTGDIDLSTDNGRLFARIKGATAKAETERRSARQKAKFRQLAVDGRTWTSKRPFGYNFDDTTVPEEAAAVAEAYEMVLAGHSLMSIVRDWNERGLTSTLGKPFRTQVSVRKILQNPRYAGLRFYNGEYVGKAKWPAIVTEDVYRAACDVLADPSRRSGTSTGRVYLQVGIALCGLCGDTVDVTGTSKGRVPVYRCRGCFGVNKRVALADDHITDLVIAWLSQPFAADILIDQNRPDLHELRLEAAALREKLDTLAIDYADGVITRDQLRLGTERARSRLGQVESIMEDANRARLFKGVIGDGAKTFPDLMLDRRRAIIDSLMVITFHKALRPGRFDPASIQVEWKQ